MLYRFKESIMIKIKQNKLNIKYRINIYYKTFIKFFNVTTLKYKLNVPKK